MIRFGGIVGCLMAAGVAAGLTAPPADAIPGLPMPCPGWGTVGLPDSPAGGTGGFDRLALAPAGLALPATVNFRDTTATYNYNWDFALRGGTIYTKPHTLPGEWRVAPAPSCMRGNIAGISADDDELLAITSNGGIRVMDHAMNGPAQWNWSKRWGVPFWLGSGQSMPPGVIDWSWSVLSPNEDVVWSDGAGNPHHVGLAKVSHIYALTGAGNRITYLDPWLPVDYSYEVQSPLGGRFIAKRISVSGSTMFVTNQFGDMYSRLFDFDISGADTVFFRYAYNDQRGKPVAPDLFSEKLNTGYAAIQLPVVGWQRQPKIPGEITDEISIHKTGRGSNSRELRVEGRQAGVTGYWRKTVTEPGWSFTPTAAALLRAPILNPPGDTSANTLAPAPTLNFSGTLSNGVALMVPGFDVANEQTPLMATLPDGVVLPLVLHTVDALRQFPRAPGLTGNPRTYDASIEVPAAILDSLATQPESVRDFVKKCLGGRRFTYSKTDVTATSMTIAQLNYVKLRA